MAGDFNRDFGADFNNINFDESQGSGGNFMANFSGGPKTGSKCKLYRNTGTHDAPEWEEIKAVGDASLEDLVRQGAELKRRGNQYIKKLPSLISAFTFNFQLVHGLEKAMFDLLKDSFFSGAVVEYALCDGDITHDGTNGFRSPMMVEDFPFHQGLEDAIGHAMKLALAYMADGNGDEIDPEWFEVEGST